MGAKRPNKLHIKAGDTVIVLRGKDAPTRNNDGQVVYTRGRVLQLVPKGPRALGEGGKMVKKHTPPSPENPQGGIIEVEAPIHISNLMLEDPKTKEPTRIGYKFVEGKDGKMKKV